MCNCNSRSFTIGRYKVRADLVGIRQEICNSCDHRIKLTNQCNVCYCFISLKAAVESESCPLGKWQAIEKTLPNPA